MKMQYSKPTLNVEYYSLTQSIAACSGIKIALDPNNILDSIMKDPDATDAMKTWAEFGGFLSTHGCDYIMDLHSEDGACYHTNLNAAFNS